MSQNQGRHDKKRGQRALAPAPNLQYFAAPADTDNGTRLSEAPMAHTMLLTMLFLGNAALLYLWSSYIIKVLRGHCPHCGK